MLKKGGLAVLMLLWAAVAGAQEASTETDGRWYLSPSVGVAYSGSDAGPLGALSIGRSLTEFLGVEVEAGFSDYKPSDLNSKNSYKRAIAGVDLLGYLAPQDSTVRPFLIAGANVHDVKFIGEKIFGTGVNVGGGAMFALSNHWDLRLQARYNLDFISAKGPVPEDTFYLWDITTGLRYKFGSFPSDEDGDGVPDYLDRCPHTPAHVKVDASGCPLDSDGDGVPDYLDKCPNTPR